MYDFSFGLVHAYIDSKLEHISLIYNRSLHLQPSRWHSMVLPGEITLSNLRENVPI